MRLFAMEKNMEFQLPDFGFETPDVDFDLSDFQLLSGPTLAFGEPQQRILQPRIAKDELLQNVLFENAEEFAAQIDLERPDAHVRLD